MAERIVSRLETFFTEQADGDLRSIIKYEEEDSEVIYLRDDVGDRYTDAEQETVIDDSRMESLFAPIYDDTFSVDHGDLLCLVKCFENVVEMNFILADGVGVAVALDETVLTGASGLVAEAREIVVDEQEDTHSVD